MEAGGSESTLKNYFEGQTFAQYENISVGDLNFSSDVKMQLNENKIFTLGELFSCPLEKLRNANNIDIDNIIKTLKIFFNYEKLTKEPDFINSIEQKISALPEEIKNRNLLPFIHVYNLKGNNLSEEVPQDLSVKDFFQYLNDNPEIYKPEELEIFINWLNFDINSEVQKVFDKIFINKREILMIHDRIAGKTLNEIGIKFGITRQRVNQVERPIIKKFLKNYSAYLKDMVLFLCVLSGEKNMIKFEDFENILGEDHAQILWYLLRKIKPSNFNTQIFHYDENLESIILTQKNDDKAFVAESIADFLPDLIEENILDETIRNLAKEKGYPEEVLRIKFFQTYHKSGKFFHRHRLTNAFKWNYILRERFQNGYKISDETDYARFLRYLEKIFGDKKIFSQRNIDATIANVGVLCDRGKYIHRDFVHIPPQIVSLINDFIEKSDKTALLYKEIFESLKDQLVGTQITNHYFLQGVIKMFGPPYSLRKDYLTKDTALNLSAEFNNFIKKNGEVTAQDIKNEFISFNESNIHLLLSQCPEIIVAGEGLYFHSSNLNLTEADYTEIENFLRQVCENIPASSRMLFDLFSDKFSDFLARNNILRHEKLFGVLRYMFKDKFYFSRPYISISEIKFITNKKVLLMSLENINKIEIKELQKICEEQSINFSTSSYLVETLRPEFIRIDEFTLMRPEILGITDEIIMAVCDELKSAIKENGGWKAAKNFTDYEWLPQLDISWNSFLIESIASLANEKFKVMRSFSSDTSCSSAVFVSSDFADYDFNSFLLKTLKDADEKKPFQTRKEILNWLKSQGFCNTKMPKFLIDEGYIKFSSKGKIELKNFSDTR